eukprot:717583-Pelagomonas_calceolata.AAC.1
MDRDLKEEQAEAEALCHRLNTKVLIIKHVEGGWGRFRGAWSKSGHVLHKTPERHHHCLAPRWLEQ